MTLPDFLWYFIVFSSLYIVEDVTPFIEMVSTHNFFANENFQTFVLRQENKVEQSTLLNVNCRLGLFLSSFKILLTKQITFEMTDIKRDFPTRSTSHKGPSGNSDLNVV